MAKKKNISTVENINSEDNKNLPSTEKINSQNNIEIKSQLNVNLTKEDLFLIKCAEQEEVFEKEISLLDDLILNLGNKIKEEKESTCKKIEKILLDFITKTYNTNEFFTVTPQVDYGIVYGNPHRHISIYDIECINNLKNPLRAKKTNYFPIELYQIEKCEISNLKISLNYKIEHEVEKINLSSTKTEYIKNLQSFPKKDISTIVKLMRESFERVNTLYEQYADLKVQKNELEFQLITMDSNKKLKSAFIKNIIKDNPEITKFLK